MLKFAKFIIRGYKYAVSKMWMMTDVAFYDYPILKMIVRIISMINMIICTPSLVIFMCILCYISPVEITEEMWTEMETE